MVGHFTNLVANSERFLKYVGQVDSSETAEILLSLPKQTFAFHYDLCLWY